MVLGGWLSAGPAAAFELFGFRLWGEDPAAEDIIDPVPYTVTLVVLSDDTTVIERMGQASVLIAREDQPPSGTVGLLARARDDREGLLATLYEEARYGGTIDIEIAGRPLDAISVTETLAPPDQVVPVRITVDPGPMFMFGSVVVAGHDAPDVAAAVAASAGLEPGAPARSGAIIAAEGRWSLPGTGAAIPSWRWPIALWWPITPAMCSMCGSRSRRARSPGWAAWKSSAPKTSTRTFSPARR
jgi:translocation and assembly module TamA